jgi:hypothetical protein
MSVAVKRAGDGAATIAPLLRSAFRRLRGRLDMALQPDTAFLEWAYRQLLGREIDQDGLNYYREALRRGETRGTVLLSLATSEEFVRRHARVDAPPLPSLRGARPERYRREIDLTTNQPLWVFEAEGPGDIDWLEGEILANGYYEQPGVWNLGVDVDKRVMAEIVASLAPRRALELGCAAGAVIECLRDLGIEAEGVEISARAAERAPAGIRSSIHTGDLLDIALPRPFDVTFGLDVFEHLNPNRLERYLSRLAALTCEGGYLFANVPAFGEDPVFGTVFPFYVGSWRQDADLGRPFGRLHADQLGYPLHGHLVWADAGWWVRRFEAAGLRREPAIEKALHAKYDAYMDKRSLARKAYFVFSKGATQERNHAVAESIRNSPSKALA